MASLRSKLGLSFFCALDQRGGGVLVSRQATFDREKLFGYAVWFDWDEDRVASIGGGDFTPVYLLR